MLSILNKPISIGRWRVRTVDLLSSIAAALGYGGWAVYANFEVSHSAAFKAGGVQGTYAFTSTLFLTVLIRKIYHAAGRGTPGRAVAAASGIAVIVTLPALLNIAAQTPNVLMTILPGVIIGSAYVAGFTFFLE